MQRGDGGRGVIIRASVYSMNWLDGEHTCIYTYIYSMRASLYQLVHFYCPPSAPFFACSAPGKLFFNYFLCTQVNGLMSLSLSSRLISLLCSSNRCCHMPWRASLQNFISIYELFMLQWKFLSGNASRVRRVREGITQNKRAIWQIVDLPHSHREREWTESQLITLCLCPNQKFKMPKLTCF